MIVENISKEHKTKGSKCTGKTSSKKQIQVLSVNQPTQEESQAKIKELSEYLSVAWVSPDNLE